MSEKLTAAQAAIELQVSPNFVKAELRRKNMRGSLTPAGWRIDPSDLKVYFDAHANVAEVRRVS